MQLPALGSDSGRALLARIIANGIGQIGATWGRVLIVRLAFDRLIGTEAVELRSWTWPLMAAALVVAYGGRGWLRRQERVDAERLGQQYAHRVRLLLFEHLTALSPRTLQVRSHGTVMLRFIGDLSALRLWVSRGVARLTVAAITVLGSVTIIAVLNPALGLTVALSVALTAGLVLPTARGIREAVGEVRRRRSHLAANVSEKVSAMAVVQACGRTRRERQQLEQQSGRLRDASVARARVAGTAQGITDFCAGLTITAILMVGAVEAGAGRATGGTVVAVLLVARSLLPMLSRLARAHEFWQGARVARDKIGAFLAAPQQLRELPDARRLRVRHGRIDLKQVTVRGSLRSVSGSVEAHSVVALVGPNGGGKSTLLATLAGLVVPESGSVHIDRHDITHRRRQSLHRQVSILSPDLPLVRGTIDKNVRYRWRHAPQEAVAEALEASGVNEILRGLPDGIKTRLLDGGRNLSVGQRRRIALARAILGTPAILLLDEPEAHLDARTSRVLEQVVRDYPGTVLWATHEPGHVAIADEVWCLIDGHLVDVRSSSDVLDGQGPAAACLGIRSPATSSNALTYASQQAVVKV